MKIETLERYIKYTNIPYPDLIERAKKTLKVGKMSNDGTLEIHDNLNRQIILYFESKERFLTGNNCLIATWYNYKN